MEAGDWTIPPALAQPVPRQVRLSPDSKFALSVIAGLFLVSFGLVITVASLEAYRESRILADGADREATIVRIDRRRDRTGDFQVITYRYTALEPNGELATFEDKATVRSDRRVLLFVGAQAPIIIDPRKPWNSLLNIGNTARDVDPWKKISILLGIIAACLTVFITLFATVLSRVVAKEYELMRLGEAAAATILAEAECSYRFKRMSALSYAFTDAQGVRREGVQKWVPTADDPDSSAQRRRAEILSNPTAVFHPRDSRKSMLYAPMSWAITMPSGLR